MLAMMVITICSFMLNLPGLRLQVYPKVVNWRVGRTFSKNLPAGKPLSTINRQPLLVGIREGGTHSNWARLEPTSILGYRMLKN
jgi:hypothetical protein